MDLRPCSKVARQFDKPYAVVSKKEPVVKYDVNGTFQELRCRTPDELSTGEHAPRVLLVTYRGDRISSERSNQPAVKREQHAVCVGRQADGVCGLSRARQ